MHVQWSRSALSQLAFSRAQLKDRRDCIQALSREVSVLHLNVPIGSQLAVQDERFFPNPMERLKRLIRSPQGQNQLFSVLHRQVRNDAPVAPKGRKALIRMVYQCKTATIELFFRDPFRVFHDGLLLFFLELVIPIRQLDFLQLITHGAPERSFPFGGMMFSNQPFQVPVKDTPVLPASLFRERNAPRLQLITQGSECSHCLYPPRLGNIGFFQLTVLAAEGVLEPRLLLALYPTILIVFAKAVLQIVTSQGQFLTFVRQGLYPQLGLCHALEYSRHELLSKSRPDPTHTALASNPRNHESLIVHIKVVVAVVQCELISQELPKAFLTQEDTKGFSEVRGAVYPVQGLVSEHVAQGSHEQLSSSFAPERPRRSEHVGIVVNGNALPTLVLNERLDIRQMLRRAVLVLLGKHFPRRNAVEEAEDVYANHVVEHTVKAPIHIVNDVLQLVLRNAIKDAIHVGELPVVQHRIVYQRSVALRIMRDASQVPFLPPLDERIEVYQSLARWNSLHHIAVVSFEPVHSFTPKPSNAS